MKASKKVLLVDDEQIVANVGRKMLEKMGYGVLTASTGGEALDLYRRNREDIGLVILDMVMPDLDGVQAYVRLRELNPEVKVLLSTGHEKNGTVAEIMSMGCNGFIQKPFTIGQLSHKMREVLDS
jgi:DNA-binding NtrC family response regulator